MKLTEWEGLISKTYNGRNRDILGMVTNLQIEASELAELIVKQQWYNKVYSFEELLSEAGDVLNFLTIILQSHGSSINEAMTDNIIKLKKRGWLE